MYVGGQKDAKPPNIQGRKWVCMSPRFNIVPGHCVALSFGIDKDFSFDDDLDHRFNCKVTSFYLHIIIHSFIYSLLCVYFSYLYSSFFLSLPLACLLSVLLPGAISMVLTFVSPLTYNHAGVRLRSHHREGRPPPLRQRPLLQPGHRGSRWHLGKTEGKA